ncbi:MAG: GNAT family N-acetyltransferase, partial [Sphingobacteriales bacterium]
GHGQLVFFAEQLEFAFDTAPVFDIAVAPHYQTDGVSEFHRFASPEALSQRHQSGHVTLVAEDSGAIVGMLHLRLPSHISMLFVHPLR